MCLYPKLIFNQKYWANKKNGGNVPIPKDKRVLKVPVGCGRCIECRQKKAREWTVRLNEEVRNHNNGVFVSLTWSNEMIKELSEQIEPHLEGYERDNAIAKLGVRRFLERYRKENKVSCKHWLVTELGQEGTENVHVHGIIWADRDQITKHWSKNGFSYMGYETSERTVNYIVKYISKTDEKHPEFQSKVLTSPGIGSDYTKRVDFEDNAFRGEKTREYYTTRQGVKLAMPIYYRNKRYSDEEREELWLQKLDKKERWVRGTRIDVSTEEGMKKYMEKLEYEQSENIRLGYLAAKSDWEKKAYEIQKRNLNFEKRTKPKNNEEKEKPENHHETLRRFQK